MKLLPRNWLLLALVVLLASLQLFLRRAPVTAGSEGLLFPQLDLRLVAGIRIEAGPEGGPDVLLLERTPAGWCVPSAFDHPALPFAVDELLDGLAALRAENRAARMNTSHARLGVDAAGTRITLTDAAGEPLLALVQGVPPEAHTEAGAAFAAFAAFVGSYVRPRDADTVVRAPHLAPVSLEPHAWFDGQLLAFDKTQVLRIAARLAPDGVALDLERAPDGTWRSVASGAGETRNAISLVAVQRVLDAASALWASEAIGPREGPEQDALAEPELQLVLGLEGATTGTAAEELGLVVAGPWTTEQRRARAGTVAAAPAPGANGAVGSPTGWPVSLSNLSADRLTSAIRALAQAAAAAAEPAKR